MITAKMILLHSLAMAILIIGAFSTFGDPWTIYAANLFTAVVVLAGINIFILFGIAIDEPLSRKGRQAMVDQYHDIHAIPKILIIIMHCSLIIISFMVGWAWSGTILVLHFMFQRFVLEQIKEDLFKKIMNK